MSDGWLPFSRAAPFVRFEHALVLRLLQNALIASVFIIKCLSTLINPRVVSSERASIVSRRRPMGIAKSAEQTRAD